MRELNQTELEEVAGGFLPLAMLGGAAFAGITSYASGNSIQTSLGAAALGALGGGAGAVAKASIGATRFVWAARSTGLNFAGGVASDANAGGMGSGLGDGEAQELEVAK